MCRAIYSTLFLLMTLHRDVLEHRKLTWQQSSSLVNTHTYTHIYIYIYIYGTSTGMGNIIIHACASKKWPATICDCLATLASAPAWWAELMASGKCAVTRCRPGCNSLDGSQGVFETEVRSYVLVWNMSPCLIHFYKGCFILITHTWASLSCNCNLRFDMPLVNKFSDSGFYPLILFEQCYTHEYTVGSPVPAADVNKTDISIQNQPI